MLSFNVQLNTVNNDTKTLNEAIEEVFSTQKPTVDLTFFYNERKDNNPKINKNRDNKPKFPSVNKYR